MGKGELTLWQRARYADALRKPLENVDDRRGTPIYNRQMTPYVPGQDHTFTADEGLLAHKTLPYIDPVSDWWAEHPEELDAYLDKLGWE